MRTTVKARNFELGPRLRGQIERKIGRLSRVVHTDAEVNLELTANASRSAPQAHVAEVVLINDGIMLRSEAYGPTPIAALDTLLDRLERQIVRARERPRSLRERRPEDSEGTPVFAAPATAEVSDSDITSGGPRIVKIKRFHMTPMFEEDAITRMTELGHAFFVFLNAETERIGVVYRRADGAYGLIDPMVGSPGERG
jgi:putative sigma-54 modulation protein